MRLITYDSFCAVVELKLSHFQTRAKAECCGPKRLKAPEKLPFPIFAASCNNI